MQTHRSFWLQQALTDEEKKLEHATAKEQADFDAKKAVYETKKKSLDQLAKRAEKKDGKDWYGTRFEETLSDELKSLKSQQKELQEQVDAYDNLVALAGLVGKSVVDYALQDTDFFKDEPDLRDFESTARDYRAVLTKFRAGRDAVLRGT